MQLLPLCPGWGCCFSVLLWGDFMTSGNPEIQWRRQATGSAIPCFRSPGSPRWQPYTQSLHKVEDAPDTFSPGMATWRKWLDLGYAVVPGVADDR